MVGSEWDEELRCGRSAGSGTGKKLGTKHDISLAESGHFLPRLFRRVLRLERRERNFVFLARKEGNAGARTHHTSRVAFSQPPRKDTSSTKLLRE